MKKHTFTSSFSSYVKPLVSEEKDKLLAVASLKEIGKFIPNIDTAKNTDLLPVAFNACVVNRVNKNGDVIDTPTAIGMYKEFVNKPINLEHHRQQVIGVILTAGFSAFGTDQPLTEEEVKTMKTPFNITLGGLVWRVVNPDLADYIEESNDSTSDSYLGISASWELGFSEYDIAILPAGVKNIADAKIISDPTEIEKIKKYLRAQGGDGKIGDDFYYRKPKDVLPLGIGFTEKPAADVKGILTEEKKDANASEVEVKLKAEVETLKAELETAKATVNKLTNTSKNISQTPKPHVDTERKQSMKFNTLKDITDENLKEAKASEIADFVAAELKKGNETYLAEKNALNDKLSKAEADTAKVTKEHQDLLAKVTQLEATVTSLNKEKADREAVDKFNARMNEITEAYTLEDDVRAVLVEEIKALASDEDFDKWKKKAAVIYKGYAKSKKNDNDEDDKGKNSNQDAGAKKKDAKADDDDDADDSEAKKKAKAAEAVAKLTEELEKAKKEAGLPNSTAGATDLKTKYKEAFAMEQFIVTR